MIYFDIEKPSGTYATVWEVKKNDKGFVKGRVGTSEKNKETGEYINSNWFVTFSKSCSEKALTLNPKDRIIIDKFALKHPSFKKDDGTYVDYLDLAIFHFKKVDEDGNAESSAEAPNAKGTKFPKPTPPIETMKASEPEEESKLPFDL
jgi:hypothetical protein